MQYLYKEIFGPSWIESLPQNLQDDLLCGKPIVLGHKIYQVCDACKNVVRTNKFLLGDGHFCYE